MKSYVGTSGYSYKGWKGSFYPEDLPTNAMLGFYAGHLPSVEINNTFYRLPRASVLESWAEQVGEDFRFVLKDSRRITHIKRLKGADDETGYLLRTAGTLGARLGAFLFQLPPNLRKDIPRLEEFLGLLPDETSAAFELRHPSWLDPEVFDLLRGRDCALCISDTDEEPATELVSTASWGYVRLRRSGYDEAELASWARRLRRSGWDRAYVFLKHEEEGPALAARLLRLLERAPARRRAPKTPAEERRRA